MNRTVRPVCFAFEPDVVSVFANISFGAAGAPTFTVGTNTQSNNVQVNKGLCNIALNTIAFTGTTTNGSPTVTSVSSFAGLYNGMTVTGTNIPAATTISSMAPGSGTITLSANATGANTGLTASGGQYTLTFGSQFTPFKRLDSYVRLLALHPLWELNGLQGGASTGASSPAAPTLFLVNNSISNASLASLTFQLGTLSGATFVAASPANGEKLKLAIHLTRSTAV